MSVDNSEGLKKFFEYVWRDTPGFVYLPTIRRGQEITKFMFEWPRQKNAIVKHVTQQDALGNDVFYAPAIFSEPKPEQEYVKGTHIFWVDFDGGAPDSWPAVAKRHNIPEPALEIASSVEGREHAYWPLAGFETDIQQINSRNRALAYTLGADTSGWDANQFLRPPFTHNYGYNNKGEHKEWFSGEPVSVRVIRAVDQRVNPNVFNPLGTPEHIVETKIELGEIPSLAEVFMDTKWPENFKKVFNYTREEAAGASSEGRSGTLSALGYFGAENGFTDEQIYAVLLDADDRWEKYKGRHDRERRLVEIIARARAKHGYLTPDDLTFAGLVKDPATPVVTDRKLVYSFRELSELEIKVDWMLEGLLRNEGVGIIVGPPNVGKTQLLIQMGAHVALGWDLLGWKCASGPKKVMFWSLEMDLLSLSIFWNLIKKNYPDSIEELHSNFQVMPMGEGIALDTPMGQAFAEKILTEYQPDLLIVDSLQKVTSKELTDELSVKFMLEFIDRMRIKHHTAVVFVHHNRKKSNDSLTKPDELDDMYGSRYISANIEFALSLRALSSDTNTVTHVKSRLGPTRKQFDITRNGNLQYVMGQEVVGAADYPGRGFIDGARARLISGGTSQPGEGGGMLSFGGKA